MTPTIHTSTSLQQTYTIATALASQISPGTIVLLNGELGAGKTSFAQGFAQGLGITEHLTSPTFTLMQVYPLPHDVRGIKKLVHIDAYRLNDSRDFFTIGADDFIGRPDTVSLIEWAERIPELAQYPHLINITLTCHENGIRTISITQNTNQA